jgi:hypothetical protein
MDNSKLSLIKIFEKENILGQTLKEIMEILEKEEIETIDDLTAMTNEIQGWKLKIFVKKKLSEII